MRFCIRLLSAKSEILVQSSLGFVLPRNSVAEELRADVVAAGVGVGGEVTTVAVLGLYVA